MSQLMVDEAQTEHLVERARGGDREAFDRLVVRFGDRLETSIRARLKVFGVATLESDEILQDVFFTAFELIGDFQWRGEEAFYGWLSQISRNVLLKAARRASRVRSLALDPEVPSDGTTSPSKVLRREERLERLEARLKDLSSEHRQVVLLAKIEGLSMKEIAARMGRSPEAVKQLLSRALLKLRKSFGDTDSFHLPERGLNLEEKSDER